MAHTEWRVIGSRGCGSVLVEAALTLANIPFTREEVDYATPSPERDRLLALNPLGQVPTLLAPDGAVMTESAAVILHLDELAPEAKLLPRPGDPARREALRWLVFLVAAVYPTFTYGDEPEKWVGDAGPRLRESTFAHRKKLWLQLEGAAKAPWFLGETRSMLDVYVSVMTRWRPNRPWFAKEAPKLSAIAQAVDAEPRLAKLFAANFDD
ncbi:MAG: glutathione S-transferase family protein [Kofleriaceae bacterium]|nr:glutathione S-transferase family protein [Kofleriaceae bacterium]